MIKDRERFELCRHRIDLTEDTICGCDYNTNAFSKVNTDESSCTNCKDFFSEIDSDNFKSDDEDSSQEVFDFSNLVGGLEL